MKHKIDILSRMLTGLFLAALLIGNLYVPVYADGEKDPVEYVDENGEIQTCTEYEILDTSTFADSPEVTISSGWYVVKGNVTYQNRLTIDAEYEPEFAEEYGLEPARIILCDGCRLDLKQGIHLGRDNGLMIYAQSQGTGTLNAEYDETRKQMGHAVIGGNEPREFSGYLDINGGVINVTGRTSGACLGGSEGGSLDEINIRGGKIRLENKEGAPAIGVGLCYNRGNIGTVNITGGEIYADSQFEGLRTSDAIGGHYECGGLRELNITGGQVIAFGRYATVGMDPCAMMTYGSINLGDDMTVWAGYDGDHTTKAETGDRVHAIRSNCYAVVQAPGFAAPAPSKAGSVFGHGSTKWFTIISAAVIILAAALFLIIKRNKNKKAS